MWAYSYIFLSQLLILARADDFKNIDQNTMSHKCEHATNFPSRTVRDTYDLVLLIARNPWFVESKDFSVGQSKVLG